MGSSAVLHHGPSSLPVSPGAPVTLRAVGQEEFQLALHAPERSGAGRDADRLTYIHNIHGYVYKFTYMLNKETNTISIHENLKTYLYKHKLIKHKNQQIKQNK